MLVVKITLCLMAVENDFFFHLNQKKLHTAPLSNNKYLTKEWHL